MTQYKKKLTNEEFFTILRENGGRFSQTALAIEKKYDIKYSRQAVKQRAQKHPEILEDIKEQGKDIAKEALMELIRQDDDKKVKLNATKYFLSTQYRDEYNTKPEEKDQEETIEHLKKIEEQISKFTEEQWKKQ